MQPSCCCCTKLHASRFPKSTPMIQIQMPQMMSFAPKQQFCPSPAPPRSRSSTPCSARVVDLHDSPTRPPPQPDRYRASGQRGAPDAPSAPTHSDAWGCGCLGKTPVCGQVRAGKASSREALGASAPTVLGSHFFALLSISVLIAPTIDDEDESESPRSDVTSLAPLSRVQI